MSLTISLTGKIRVITSVSNEFDLTGKFENCEHKISKT
jgi:hypothetical protein